MDDADSGLEIRPQSVRHPVRRQGAGMNTSYTVNLTPPLPPRYPTIQNHYRFIQRILFLALSANPCQTQIEADIPLLVALGCGRGRLPYVIRKAI